VSERVRNDRKRGRAEAALEQELIERRDIGSTERAALRVQAHALDLAEALADPDVVSRASDCYLHLRAAAGLTSGGSKPVDAFDALLAELARPGAGASNPTPP
jgi:hypothetical protein